MHCNPLTESVQLGRTRPKTISVIGFQPLGAVSSVEWPGDYTRSIETADRRPRIRVLNLSRAPRGSEAKLYTSVPGVQ